jgi:Mg-chelatase subunit ChlD
MITEIAFILDRSGSMETVRQAAIDGFNEFLLHQQAASGHIRLTLVLFDDWIETHYHSIPICEAVPLTHETFVPRNSTSLLDAIGDTMEVLGQRFATMPEVHRPDRVILAILTDGRENSSERFTWEQVTANISHQTQKYGWEFLFLGAGVETIATANSTPCRPQSAEQGADSARTLQKIDNTSILKALCATHEQGEQTAKPLQETLREEDEKRHE